MANDLHFAVVVGINRYPGIRDLSAARGDAERFRDWLVSPEGGDVPDANVHLVTVPDEEALTFRELLAARPKRAEVNHALKTFNGRVRESTSGDRSAWERTRLYVYVSGHGIAPADGQAALLMADADRDTLGENIELSRYEAWYASCGVFKEIVIFADCCRERHGAVPPANAPPFNICVKPEGITNTVVGYATALSQEAYEPMPTGNPDDERGFFTQALLMGLSGDAQDEATGEITSKSLSEYVAKAVDTKSKARGRAQAAEMHSDFGHPIVFRTGAPRVRWNVTLEFPDDYGGKVSLLSGVGFSSLGEWEADDGPWSVKLDAGMYVVRSADGQDAGFADRGRFDVIGEDVVVRL